MAALLNQLLMPSIAQKNLENITQRQDTKGYIPHDPRT